MWRLLAATVSILVIAACVQIPPSQQEIADKRVEPVAGKAVVYIVQPPFGTYDAGLLLDESTQIRTWPGTFYRWETTPGAHAIRSSQANLSARIKLNVEAGKVYFVQHTVNGIRGSTTDASLGAISEKLGRELVAKGRSCCN
jgi:hypothetical protein